MIIKVIAILRRLSVRVLKSVRAIVPIAVSAGSSEDHQRQRSWQHYLFRYDSEGKSCNNIGCYIMNTPNGW